MTDNKIDMKRIADDTGVEYDDVTKVLYEIIGGDQGTWLFTSHIEDDQVPDLRH